MKFVFSHSAVVLMIISDFFKNTGEKIMTGFYSEFFHIGPIKKILSDEADREFQLWKEQNLEQGAKLIGQWEDGNFEENFAHHTEMRKDFMKTISKITNTDEIIIFAEKNTDGIFFTAFCAYFLGEKFQNAKIILLDNDNYDSFLGKKNIEKWLVSEGDNFPKSFFENFWNKIPDGNLFRLYKNAKLHFWPLYRLDGYIFSNFSDKKWKFPSVLHKKYRELNNLFFLYRIYFLEKEERLQKKKWIFKNAYNYQKRDFSRHKTIFKIKKYKKFEK